MHATLADVIADTAQNSIEAGARHVSLSIVEDGGKISVSIRDDGKGMDEETLARAFNPFYTEPGKHDKRKVGLGLPILKQICESCDGEVSLGDLAAAVMMLFNYPGDFDLSFSHRRGAEEYSISRLELAEAVGGLESVDGISLAREFLKSQEEELKSGVSGQGSGVRG